MVFYICLVFLLNSLHKFVRENILDSNLCTVPMPNIIEIQSKERGKSNWLPFKGYTQPLTKLLGRDEIKRKESRADAQIEKGHRG